MIDLDEMEAQYGSLPGRLGNGAAGDIQRMLSEIKKLREANRILKEGLEFYLYKQENHISYSEFMSYDNGHSATKALAEAEKILLEKWKK